MQLHFLVLPSFIALSILTQQSFGVEPMDEPASNRDVPWEDYLELAGGRLGAHFTIERVLRGSRDPQAKVVNVKISDDEQLKTLEAVASKLATKLPGFDFVPNPQHPQVMHVIERELLEQKRYSLDRKHTLAYSGILGDLSHVLEQQLHNIGPKTAGDWRRMFDDSVTRIEINEKDKKLRDIITDCLPLKDRQPLLWLAETQLSKDGVHTTLQFYGPVMKPTND